MIANCIINVYFSFETFQLGMVKAYVLTPILLCFRFSLKDIQGFLMSSSNVP